MNTIKTKKSRTRQIQTFRLVEWRDISRSNPLVAQSRAPPGQLVRGQQATAQTPECSRRTLQRVHIQYIQHSVKPTIHSIVSSGSMRECFISHLTVCACRCVRVCVCACACVIFPQFILGVALCLYTYTRLLSTEQIGRAHV